MPTSSGTRTRRATKSMPPTLRKYQTLKKRKAAFCTGKIGKGLVKQAAVAYVTAAVAKGQTREEAQKKANAVLNSACKMTARVAGARRRKAATGTRKRRTTTTTATRRRTSTARRRK